MAVRLDSDCISPNVEGEKVLFNFSIKNQLFLVFSWREGSMRSSIYLAASQKLFRHFIDISSDERNTCAERKIKQGNHPEKREQFSSYSSVADDTRVSSLCCGRREAIKRVDRGRLRREMSSEMWVPPPPPPPASGFRLGSENGETEGGCLFTFWTHPPSTALAKKIGA